MKLKAYVGKEHSGKTTELFKDAINKKDEGVLICSTEYSDGIINEKLKSIGGKSVSLPIADIPYELDILQLNDFIIYHISKTGAKHVFIDAIENLNTDRINHSAYNTPHRKLLLIVSRLEVIANVQDISISFTVNEGINFKVPLAIAEDPKIAVKQVRKL